MKLALVLMLIAADGGVTLYSGVTQQPVGLIQLEMKGAGKAHFRQVVSIHLPPAEIENVDVAVSGDGGVVCLTPQPRAIDGCLQVSGASLIATMKTHAAKVTLERR